MQAEFSLGTIENLFLCGNIDYQYYQYEWNQCNAQKAKVENHGDYLNLDITGEDSIGPYSFTGQVVIQNGKYFMQCKKMYLNGANGDTFVYYDGYYDKEKNGFFGKWYFDEPYEGEDNFFIKFAIEE